MVEMTRIEDESCVERTWMLYVDGLLNDKGSGVGVILEGPNDVVLKYSLKFNFKATNNQAKYEVLLVSLQLAKEVRVWLLNIRSDSQLVIAQLKGEYEVKEPLLVKYAQMAKRLLEDFEYNLQRILREENGQTDAFTKLASAKTIVNN